MTQLFCRNLSAKIFCKPSNNKYFLDSSLSCRQFSFFSNTMLKNFTFFTIIRQTLINNRNLIFNKLKAKTNLFRNILRNVRIQTLQCKKLYALSFTAGLFSWDDCRVTDNEVKKEINDVFTAFKLNNENNNNHRQIDFELSRNIQEDGWEKIFDKKDLIIWRRRIVIEDNDKSTSSDSVELYEYKVLGRISDVTPIEFYQTQIDLDFRKQWDYLVISIEIIDKDKTSKTELIRWFTKFPYPLYPREYVFVRRHCIEPDEKFLILISRAIPQIDLSKFSKKSNKNPQSVRVDQYKSNMVIIPHSDFEKPGLDYVMQYYDVNKANIPKMAYSWMASSGLPDYIEKLHKATLQLKKINQKISKNNKNVLSGFEMFYLKEMQTDTIIDNETNHVNDTEESKNKNDEIINEKNIKIDETKNENTKENPNNHNDENETNSQINLILEQDKDNNIEQN